MRDVFLIVLYKQDLYTSKTLTNILAINPENTHLVLWDNSPDRLPEDQVGKLSERFTDFEYQHTPQNIPLSCIYNRVIESHKEYRLLFLFDQDSVLAPDYLHKMIKAYREHPDIGLFLPYVMVDELVVSPGLFLWYKGKYLDKLTVGRIPSKGMIAITSGMGVGINRIGDLRFDENLRFYGIDTKFVMDYSRLYEYLYVVNYKLDHELSAFVQESPRKVLFRFKEYRKSSLYILSQKSVFWYAFGLLLWLVKSVLAYCQYYIETKKE